MKKTFHTPQGEETRELTTQELTDLAALGDAEAKKEIAIEDVKKATDIDGLVDIILKYLELK